MINKKNNFSYLKTIIIFSVSILIFPGFLVADDHKMIYQKDIKESIQNYLETNQPFTDLDQRLHLNFSEDAVFNIHRISEQSVNEHRALIALCSVLFKDNRFVWFQIAIIKSSEECACDSIKMIYAGKMDYYDMPSLLLFCDVCDLAESSLPNSLCDYNVWIQEVEGPNEQIWVFYNSKEVIPLSLGFSYTDTGTDFWIKVK